MANDLIVNNHLGQRMIIALVVGAIVSIGIIILRIYAVSLRGRSYRLHDYFAFAALPINVSFCIVQAVGVSAGGMGLHTNVVWSENQHAIPVAMRVYFANFVLWLSASVLIKLSILLLYLDLFGENGRFRLTCYTMMAVVCAYFVATLCYFVSLVRPLTEACIPKPSASCGRALTEQLSTGIVLIVLDLVIIFLPMPIIWSLKMSFRRKMYVSLIFALGLIVTIVNALRIYYTTTFDILDFTYCIVSVGTLAGLEIFFGLIIACAPTLQPFFVKISSLTTRYKGSDFHQLTMLRTKASARDGAGDITPRHDTPDTKNFLRLDDGHITNLISSWATHDGAETAHDIAGKSQIRNTDQHLQESNRIHVKQELDTFVSRISPGECSTMHSSSC